MAGDWTASANLRRLAVLTASSLASAFALAASQVYQGCEWLAFIGLVPLLWALDPGRLVETIPAFALTYGVFTSLTVTWIARYGQGYEGMVGAAGLYGAVVQAVPSALVVGLANRRGAFARSWLILPAAWTLMEVLSRRMWLGLSWSLLGLPLADWPWLARLASLGGPELLSFVVVAINVAVVQALGRKPRTIVGLAVAQAVVALLVAAGWSVADFHEVRPDAPTLRIGLIQPAIEQEWKGASEERRQALAKLDLAIDRVVARGAELVVLPETAVTGLVRFEDDLTTWAREAVARARTPILFGTLDGDDEGQALYNAAFLITPYNTVTSYRKTRLVPISEHVSSLGPLRRLFSTSRTDAPELTPGTDHTVFSLRDKPEFAVMICYEDVFPDLARRFASSGAEALFTLVNTIRFDGTSLPRQHLRRAVLTAASVGLPMVRCANSGVSCLIDRNGRVVAEVRGTGEAVFNLAFDPSNSPYRRFGDALPIAAMTLLIAVAWGKKATILASRPGRAG